MGQALLSRVNHRDLRSCVLIVDDDPDDIRLLDRAMRRATQNLAAVEVFHARDGADALDFLRAREPRDLPDMILLDVNMPRLDGVETLREIRSDSRLRDLTVVIVTTAGTMDLMETARSSGANEAFIKPDSLDEIDAMMRKLAAAWL